MRTIMPVRDPEALAILKSVARSFYLSVRLLPAAMRRGVATAYLLARASDTLADAPGIAARTRLQWLDAFEKSFTLDVSGRLPAIEVALPRGERVLLESLPQVIRAAASLPQCEARLVRQVVATIVSGQRLDIGRFATNAPGRIVALADAGELHDYAHRVAGSVGIFWTRLGFATLGGAFSTMPAARLEVIGEAFGRGLQLVNILRDFPADLASGRCYLPVGNPQDPAALAACHAATIGAARPLVAEGEAYAGAMRLMRLRAAVLLPAWIGRDTLDLIARPRQPGDTSHPMKIRRRRVWALLVRALCAPASQ
jgi:farnesyl-diphosphate farnesyltransferase